MTKISKHRATGNILVSQKKILLEIVLNTFVYHARLSRTPLMEIIALPRQLLERLPIQNWT